MRVVRSGGRVIDLDRETCHHKSSSFLEFQCLRPLLHFQRTQFPLRFAFAITISKSLGRVGLVVDQPVFSHGQLYVALSRVTNYNNLHLIVPNTPEARQEGRLAIIVLLICVS